MYALPDKKPFKIRHIIYLHALFSAGILLVRIFTDVNITYAFLIWNLALAYVPYFISRKLTRLNPGALSIGLLALWLLFFPNAPYLITDFVHLHRRPTENFWLDLVVFYSFALNGLAIGFVSLNKVYHWLRKFYRTTVAWITIHVALSAAAFGIYLGRIERWNSWDLFMNPFHLIRNIYHLLFPMDEQVHVWLFTLLFGVFLTAHYYFFLHVSDQLKMQHHEDHS